MTEEERLQAEILRAFEHSCDENDWAWCYAWHALDGTPSKAQRGAIKALRLAGLLKLHRGGGMDEDGNMVGGSGYGITRAGKAWLKEIEAQAELAL